MNSRTRQVVVVVALGLGLIVPVAAHAATLFFQGGGTEDPDVVVGFEIRGPAEDGHIKFAKAHIEDFVISGVKTTRACADEGTSTTSSAYFFAKDIDFQRDGDFKATERPKILGPDVEGNMVVKGQWRPRNNDFHGSFTLQAVERDPSHGDCFYSVDKARWTAFRR